MAPAWVLEVATASLLLALAVQAAGEGGSFQRPDTPSGSSARPTYQDKVIEQYRELYVKYGEDLKAVRELGSQYTKGGLIGLSMDVEAEITYLRLRDTKPEIVWEISPHSGYSTMFILSALQSNGRGHLYSFDIWEAAPHNKQISEDMRKRWTFVLGDAREKVWEFADRLPDYLFLDSFHSYEFGKFYTDRLFPALTKHTRVSIHDVYFVGPAFWSDESKDKEGHYVRNMKCHPEWFPNEEGLVILDWLIYQDYACRVFTLSNTRWPEVYKRWLAMRQEVFLDNSHAITWPFAVDHKDAWNPTLYFELNCAKEIASPMRDLPVAAAQRHHRHSSHL